MKCKQCNREIASDASFCPRCGTSQPPRAQWYDSEGRRILKVIEPHIQAGERIREYTVGNFKKPVRLSRVAGHLLMFGISLLIDFLLGAGGDGMILATQGPNSMLVLTNRRILISKITGWSSWPVPARIVSLRDVPLAQIDYLEYERGLARGTLTVHHDGGKTEVTFWKTRWGRHAENMAVLAYHA